MTDPEAAFLFLWRTMYAGWPQPAAEFRFHPKRKWRFDWSWEKEKVAVECEGGTWHSGRHVRGQGYEDDCSKYNAAQVMGWCVLRFTSDMLAEDGMGCVDLVRQALGRKL
jgi:very-short-patch-repair endonuclease